MAAGIDDASPVTLRDIEAMHGKPVLVLTHGGRPISLGRIRVSRPISSAAVPRIEIVFETETLACAIGVPYDRAAQLHRTFDGEQFVHRLPEGDRVWLEDPPPAAKSNSAAPVIETFPLPTNSKLGAPPTPTRPKRNR